MARVIFVTGTDTNVGKTAVTALLLAQAQASGINARALKPFSTGSGEDEALLGSLQKSSLRVNFFRFSEPVSPWTAARLQNSRISIEAALHPIQEHRSSCELLLVEGAGGLLTPLGEGFSAAELISELHAEVIIVAANRLGVLNHTLLTYEALRHRGVTSMQIALAHLGADDPSCKSNHADLVQLVPSVPVRAFPFLENFRCDAEFIRSSARRLHEELRSLLEGTGGAGKKNPPDTEAEGTFP